MTDADLLLDVPFAEFGSGVVGVCDVCGKRQAIIVLDKERFKLCVIDFLNKTWTKSSAPPGAPKPLYRSERVFYPTSATEGGTAPAIRLEPTKVVRHPGILIVPEVHGLTTSVLDGAVRLAREGFEVLLPDLVRSGLLGPSEHLSMRAGVRLGGGVPLRSTRIARLTGAYRDALSYLRSGALADPAKTGLVGISYGGSLALGVAAQDQRLGAIALAYPAPVRPADLVRLVSAPLFVVVGARDRLGRSAARELLEALPEGAVERSELPGARHGFLSRDLSTYDLPMAETAWRSMLDFLRSKLRPPPPKPPAPPTTARAPLAPTPAPPAVAVYPKPEAAPGPVASPSA
ncbi:MAG TPA: dienelactone hydrolase family protein [Thermoplasmata archaeon]|nr:dienelactone hydrolase family protein [Thermoplasmata archaeon]